MSAFDTAVAAADVTVANVAGSHITIHYHGPVHYLGSQGYTNHTLTPAWDHLSDNRDERSRCFVGAGMNKHEMDGQNPTTHSTTHPVPRPPGARCIFCRLFNSRKTTNSRSGRPSLAG